MSTRKTAKKTAASGKTRAAAAPTASELGTVREILFGADVQRLEQSHQALHKQFSKELAALQRQMQRSFDKQAEKLQASHQELRAQLQSERDERSAQDQALLGRLQSVAESLESKMTDRSSLARMLTEVAGHLDANKKGG